MFMGYAASYVQKKSQAEVVFRDSIARRESYATYHNFVETGGFDFIFLETATPSWDHDRQVVVELHQRCPQARLVLCGPIVLARAQEIMESLPVHACIKGEYDKNALSVVQGAQGVLDFDFLTEDEMNAAPPFLCDDKVITKYFDRNPRGVKVPHLRVWGSRGCPYKCIFCVWPATMTGNDPDGQGKRLVRYYHPAHLEPFIRDMVARHGFRSIYFDDDTFNLGDRHTLEICGMMARIKLPWSAMCRTDTISMSTWDAMKQSGCYGVKLGFESGSQYVIDNIVNKKLDLKQGVQVVRHLKSIGMTVHGTFTVGLPGETREQMQETLDYARGLPLDSLQISGTAEIEGTPLATLRKQGRLEKFNAEIDANYEVMSDGNKKSDKLMAELKR